MYYVKDLQAQIGRPVLIIPAAGQDSYAGTLEDLGNGNYRVVDSEKGPLTFHKNKIEAIGGRLIYLYLPGALAGQDAIWGLDEPEGKDSYDLSDDGNPVEPPEDD